MNARIPLSRLVVLAVVVFAAGPALADDVRVNQLMMDVQDLQRTVRDQARRIDELERTLASYRQQGAWTAPGSRKALEPPEDLWLQIRNWERIRTGMTAQEVIAILGAPASMRADKASDRKTLFYAKQIGAAGFLGGAVAFENDRVREISRPVLK